MYKIAKKWSENLKIDIREESVRKSIETFNLRYGFTVLQQTSFFTKLAY